MGVNGVGAGAVRGSRGGRAISLVVNGDDFGYSEAINEAIIRCHRAGVLTSATILVNRPATGTALALARAHPSLGVGLHLNLTEGAPALPPADIPSLVDRHGRFIPFPAQLRRIVAGRARPGEIERELRAQLASLLARGVRPTHVDGHLHVHAYPRVLPLVLRLLAEYGVPALRSPLLAAWLPLHLAARFRRSRRLPPRPSRGIQARRLARAGVIVTDFLLDGSRFLAAPDPARALLAALAAARTGTVEIMAHPAWNRDAAGRGAAEVALLTDPRLPAALDALGVRLVHYGQLAPDNPADARRARGGSS